MFTLNKVKYVYILAHNLKKEMLKQLQIGYPNSKTQVDYNGEARAYLITHSIFLYLNSHS